MKKLLLILFALSCFRYAQAQQLKPELAKCVSLQKEIPKKGKKTRWKIVWKLKKNNRLISVYFYPKKPLQRPPYKKGKYYTIYIEK